MLNTYTIYDNVKEPLAHYSTSGKNSVSNRLHTTKMWSVIYWENKINTW